MSQLKAKIISVLIVVLAVTVFKYVIPKGSIKKFAVGLLSLVIAAVIIIPTNKSKLDFSTDLTGVIQNEGVTQNAYANAIGQKVEELLKENNIQYKKVTVDAQTDENNYLLLNSISVYLVNFKDKTAVEQIILNKLGLESKVLVFK